jgi:hypothetical protein
MTIPYPDSCPLILAFSRREKEYNFYLPGKLFLYGLSIPSDPSPKDEGFTDPL